MENLPLELIVKIIEYMPLTKMDIAKLSLRSLSKDFRDIMDNFFFKNVEHFSGYFCPCGRNHNLSQMDRLVPDKEIKYYCQWHYCIICNEILPIMLLKDWIFSIKCKDSVKNFADHDDSIDINLSMLSENEYVWRKCFQCRVKDSLEIIMCDNCHYMVVCDEDGYCFNCGNKFQLAIGNWNN